MSCASESKRSVFNWKIENFHYCALQKTLWSPMFVLHTLDKAMWKIGMTSLTSKGNKVYFSVLRLLDPVIQSRKGAFNIELHISFEDGSKLKLLQKKPEDSCSVPNHTLFLFPKPVDLNKTLREKKALFLPGNAITISCYMWSEEILKESHCSARTVLGVGNYSNQIIIPKFKSSNAKVNRTVNGIEVCLKIQNDNVKVDLYYKNNRWKKCVTCELYVVDCEMKKAFSINDTHCFENGELKQEWNIPWGALSKRMLLENKDRYLHNDNLILQVSLAFSIGVRNQKIDLNYPSNQHVSTTEPEVPYALTNDLLSLYEEKHMCDFSLVAATGETFPVHKAILSSRSPVFRAMIDNDMKEKSTNSVNIPDSDSDTLNRLLLFAYTDKVENLEYDSASKLYSAADKYLIPSLKQRCSAFMKSILSVSNVCDVLAFADLHQDVDLKNAARDFVFLNDSEVIQSGEWKKILASNSNLAAETLQQLLMHKLKIQGSVQK